MESGSANTSTHILSSHTFDHLPHQQFSSRIAYANNYSNNSKARLNSLSKQKSTTRLPPITRYDSMCSPPTTNESIRYFNISGESSRGSRGSSGRTETPNEEQTEHRVRQLEWNLKFVKDDCQQILEALHLELEELKIKNRDLQFQLIASGSSGLDLNSSSNRNLKRDNSLFEPKAEQFIHKLEHEVKRLRAALTETLRINSTLRHELQSRRMSRRQLIESSGSPSSSPAIGEFNKTLQELNKTPELLNYNNCSNKPQTITNLPPITKL